MKRFLITSVILQAMMIAACTASAHGANDYRNDRGRDVRHERVTTGRHGSDQRGGVIVHRHRPAKGAKFYNRPLRGQYCYVKGERLWLADGVFYRMAYSNRGTVYIVVGYM